MFWNVENLNMSFIPRGSKFLARARPSTNLCIYDVCEDYCLMSMSTVIMYTKIIG